MRSPTQTMIQRLLACTAVGAAMAATIFVCAYFGMRNATPYEDMHRRIPKYRTDKGGFGGISQGERTLSQSLADLKGSPYYEYFKLDPSGQILDPWNHPYDYRSHGRSFTLRSLGIDGKPGGPGLARDVDAVGVVLRDGMYESPPTAPSAPRRSGNTSLISKLQSL